MSYELEYFTEFLDDPSQCSLAEFYKWVGKWAQYVKEHKNDFNYLVDDEWKEIRERLLLEIGIREQIKYEIEDEREELSELLDDVEKLNHSEMIKLMKRQVQFMKTHQEFYEIDDELINSTEEKVNDFEKSILDNFIAQADLRYSEQKLDESLADLDDEMLKIYERTGKFPFIQTWVGLKKKNNKGN